jgi:DNA polymerase-3 subunit alpha
VEGEALAKEWLKRTRGQDKVYDMISHGTLAARGALRRVGMVYDIPHAVLNTISKNIPEDDSSVSLDLLREELPELDRYAADHPEAFEHAARLQGSRATQSEHASAVVISDIPLEELMPVMKKSAKDNYLVTAFGDAADKPVTSDLGFLKFDLLRLTQLNKQVYAEELVARVHGVEVNLDHLPVLEDPQAVDQKAMNIFWVGAKLGIFQWDGQSMMAAATKRMRPESIHHLAAMNAGVRPGVSKNLEEVIRRRHGGEFEYWDPSVEPALKETFGLPLYQEQIMAVFVELGGYSAAEADDVRRIMAKYYRIKGDVAQKMLETHRERFTENAALVCAGGRELAEQIWHYCGSSSEYLFNKSHAEEYSLIAYQDAWMKAHYPDAFYASLLTYPPAWVKKPENRSSFYERCIREARAFGIDVLPPDVNDSDLGFTIQGNAVRFGLKGIKGLGSAMVADVINNRPYTSLEDMGMRLTSCNAAGRHALAQAGALDRFDARSGLTPDEQAELEEERIGVALSGEDKLAEIREDLRPMFHTADEVDLASNGQPLIVGGEIVDGREVPTKSKDGPALRLTIAFGADEYKVSVAPWKYSPELKELLASDEPVVVRGSKDTAWDCISVDKITSAREVLEMKAMASA